MKLYKKINKADLIDYLQSVKDTNSLHYGKNPIIPGNFLLFILEEMYQEFYSVPLSYLKVNFCSPAYLNERFCFIFNQNTFQITDRNQTLILKGDWKQ